MRWYVVSWNVGIQPEKGVMLQSDCLYDTIGSAEACDSSVSRWTNPRSDVVGFSQP